MAPKKKKKKNRLSKKAKKRRAAAEKQKELDLQKSLEAERQRVVREAKLKEQQRLDKIAEEKRQAKEQKRLKEEEEQLKSWRKNYGQGYGTNLEESKENEDWKNFLVCNPMPNAQHEKELTSYLSEYKKPLKIDKTDVREWLTQCEYTEIILNQVDEEKFKALSNGDMKRYEQNEDYINQYRALTTRKINEITSYYTINCDKFVTFLKPKSDNKENVEMNKFGEGDNSNVLQQYHFEHIKFGIKITVQSKGFMNNNVKFPEIGISVDIPFKFQNSKTILRVLHTTYDRYSPKEYQQIMVVGGVLDVKIFKYLPEPRQVKNWKLKFDYEVEDSLIEEEFSSLEFARGQQDVQFVYQLPKETFILPNDKLEIAIFDEGRWQADNITDVEWVDFQKKIISFKTYSLQPHAFITERCLDYPYNGWKLRCIQPDKGLLDINTKRLSLKFEIGDGYIKLLEREEPEFAHIFNKELSPGKLFKELYNCGVNLLPVEEDALTANIVSKSADAEENAIDDIAIWVKSFFVQSSRWSATLPGEKILVRLRENLEYDDDYAENQEKDWKSIAWWSNKCGILRCRDSQDKCDDKFLENTDTHATLGLLLSAYKLATDGALDRFTDKSKLIFQNTVKQVLRLTKLLTFSVK